MKRLSRRDFVKSSLLASGPSRLASGLKKPHKAPHLAVPAPPQPGTPCPWDNRRQSFSRLFMGGNLIAGCRIRGPGYVSTLMRRYNTPAKIRETLELGESQEFTPINSYVMDRQHADF